MLARTLQEEKEKIKAKFPIISRELGV